jgi:hypothetical protein
MVYLKCCDYARSISHAAWVNRIAYDSLGLNVLYYYRVRVAMNLFFSTRHWRLEPLQVNRAKATI